MCDSMKHCWDVIPMPEPSEFWAIAIVLAIVFVVYALKREL